MAREPFDDAYFVRREGTGEQMLSDRARCSNEALGMGSTAAAYSDPEYGALSAMGQELDSEQLHDGGLRKRFYHAVFVECMKKRGWTPQDPTREEARAIGHASIRRPEALDAWIKDHEPPLPAPAPAAQGSTTPASAVKETSAAPAPVTGAPAAH
jgi:hypothetical protein